MYQIIRYPDKLVQFGSYDFSECVKYLEMFNEKLKKYNLNTEKTETFLTINCKGREDIIYSIEFNTPPLVVNIFAFAAKSESICESTDFLEAWALQFTL